MNWSCVVSLIRAFLTGSEFSPAGDPEKIFEAVIRRKKIEVISDYLLIETPENCDCIHFKQKCTHDVDITAKNVDITGKNADISQQSKVK